MTSDAEEEEDCPGFVLNQTWQKFSVGEINKAGTRTSACVVKVADDYVA